MYKGGWVQKIDPETGLLVWHSQLPDLTSIHTVAWLVVSKNVVYVAAEKNLFALQTSDGTELWHVRLNASTISIGPIIQNDVLYLPLSKASNSSLLEAFTLSNGRPLWQYAVPDEFLSFQVLGTVVYGAFDTFQGTSGSKVVYYLFAVHVADGSQIWKVLTPAITGGQIAVANGYIYVGETTMPQTGLAYQSSVYAYRASNGTLFWHSSPLRLAFPSAFVVQNTLYIVSGVGLGALDLQDGHVLWQYTGTASLAILPNESPYPNVFSSPVVEDGTLFAIIVDGTSGNAILELNARDGTLIASHSIENFNAVTATVSQQGSGTSGKTALLGIGFSELASYTLSRDTSYVITTGGSLDALSNQTGSRLWSVKLDGPAVVSTIILA